MPAEFVGSNVVIVGQSFNPSIFSQLWLVRNEIVGEHEFLPGGVTSEVVVEVRTRRFRLAVVPPQLQLVPAEAPGECADLVQHVIGRIVTRLPHTPFKGIGLNFEWRISPEDGDVAALSRRLFFRDDGPIFSAFDSPDAMFGAYLSKDYRGCRLKLDIKPITLNTESGTEHRLVLAFNYHLDLTAEGAVEAIQRQLAAWNDASVEAERIVTAIPL